MGSSSVTTQAVLFEWEQILGTCTSWVLSDEHTQNCKCGAETLKQRQHRTAGCMAALILDLICFPKLKSLNLSKTSLNAHCFSLVCLGAMLCHTIYLAQGRARSRSSRSPCCLCGAPTDSTYQGRRQWSTPWKVRTAVHTGDSVGHKQPGEHRESQQTQGVHFTIKGRISAYLYCY